MLKKILFTVVLLALSGILVYQYAFIDVPVAVGAIPEGTVLEAGHVTTQKFFFTNLPEVAMKADEVIVGKTALIEVAAGSFFMPYALSEESTVNAGGNLLLDANHIIVPLIVSPQNAPTSLNVGDTVNIVAYFSASQAGARTPFAISFPYFGTVHAIKKDDAGKLSGVDVITDKSIGTELTVASIQGTIALVEVTNDAQIESVGTSVDELYSTYFYGEVAY